MVVGDKSTRDLLFLWSSPSESKADGLTDQQLDDMLAELEAHLPWMHSAVEHSLSG